MSDPPYPAADASQEQRYRHGEVIGGKYRLVRELGQGGVGRVWVAKNELLDVHVGVKLIHQGPGGATQVQAARLLQEARAAAKLRHPAIVGVFDFGETDQGDPFVVMELLHGETLARMLAREARIPATRAVEVLLPIADALATAHAQGVVHRDVKPENIFMTAGEGGRLQPKLLDFGIAQVGTDATSHKLTIQGTVLGTPDYMSPEQARGEGNVDLRTDVWSFCVVLYELLTGTVPFDEDNYNALLWAIINEPPRPTVELAAGDAELWRIVERGLRKDREERWPDMPALGHALASWLTNHGVVEDITGTSLRNWLETPQQAPPESEPLSSPERIPTLPPESDTTDNHASMATPMVRPRRALLGVLAASLFTVSALLLIAVWLGSKPPTQARGEPTLAAALEAPTVKEPPPSASEQADAASHASTAEGGGEPAPAKKTVAPKAGRSKNAPSRGPSSPAGRKTYDFGF